MNISLILLAIIVLAAVALLTSLIRGGAGGFESEQRRAGREGEELVANYIETRLNDGDTLLTNVEIEAHGKRAELDCVVVNRRGVYIIEVKNWSGELTGGEDDYEWEKTKTTDAGNTYTKTVQNPIGQVKREIYILKEYLKSRGINVWIDGYVLFVNGNSPVDSQYVLEHPADIDKAIHYWGSNSLDKAEVKRIIGALE